MRPRPGQLHPQLLARDLLDARRHRPRRLLELQLAELGLVAARARLLALELDEELARLVPRRHERQRAERRARRAAGDSGGPWLRHARRRRSRRQRMRRALGDAQRGAARARIRRDLASRRRGSRGRRARAARRAAPRSAIGSRASRGSPPNGCDADAKKRFTIRSSSEWKLITARRPPGASSGDDARQGQRELRELAIDENPKSLERARGRILTPITPRARADGLGHDRGQLPRAGRRVRPREPQQLLLQSIEQTVLHHSRVSPPSIRARRRARGTRQRIRRAWDPSACRAGRRRETRSRAPGRRSAARRCRGRAARRRRARCRARASASASSENQRAAKREARIGDRARGCAAACGIAIERDEAAAPGRAARGSRARARRGRTCAST